MNGYEHLNFNAFNVSKDLPSIFYKGGQGNFGELIPFIPQNYASAFTFGDMTDYEDINRITPI